MNLFGQEGEAWYHFIPVYSQLIKTTLTILGNKCHLRYVQANIFPGDPPNETSANGIHYSDTVQLIRGKIDIEDEKQVGINSFKMRDIDENLKIKAGIYACCRETNEESDSVIIIPSEVEKNMKLIYDFQITTREKIKRGFVFGYQNLINPYTIINQSRLL